jgi:predicted acyltransferase
MQVSLSDGTLTWHEMIYEYVFAPLASPANASLLYAIVFVLVCWIVMWALYRKGIFLKL